MRKEVKLYKERVLESFYDAISNKTLKYLHVPHSKVFYVRAAIQERTGIRYSLERIENAMVLEGWKDG
jgi:predicted glycosyltransferase involved in capsule biosynthesis